MDTIKHLRDLAPTADGGAMIVGTFDARFNGGSDLWLQKLKSDGSHEWYMSLGDEGNDSGHSIEAIPAENAFLVAGHAEHNSEQRP